MRIRSMVFADWPRVADIWSAGIAAGDATFESAPPTWAAFAAGRSVHLRLVAEDSDGALLGWVAAGPVSSRPAYAGVAEHSVYVDPPATGRGVGGALLARLVEAAEATGTWTLRSGIFPENVVSLRLHAACGFRTVGVQERVGQRDGRWRDVVLVERRSPLVGGDGPLVRVAGLAGDLDGDLAGVRGLLAAGGLPPAGLDDAWRVWVADAQATNGRVVGSAALERYDDLFLLRSVAVDAGRRGTGLGAALVRAALHGADLEVGARATVCLLTETAAGWFDRFGFAEVARAALPSAVANSAQLRGACPASARSYLRRCP